MKPAHGATRRFLPGSPFNNMPADPPVERFDVQDQVTHDRYGLGRVLAVENDDAVVVAFGSRNVHIMWPYATSRLADAMLDLGTPGKVS